MVPCAAIKRLAEHLPAEHLGRARVAALAAKQVDLQALELELLLQVGRGRPANPLAVRRDDQNLSVPFMMVEWPGKLQKYV